VRSISFVTASGFSAEFGNVPFRAAELISRVGRKVLYVDVYGEFIARVGFDHPTIAELDGLDGSAMTKLDVLRVILRLNSGLDVLLGPVPIGDVDSSPHFMSLYGEALEVIRDDYDYIVLEASMPDRISGLLPVLLAELSDYILGVVVPRPRFIAVSRELLAEMIKLDTRREDRLLEGEVGYIIVTPEDDFAAWPSSRVYQAAVPSLMSPFECVGIVPEPTLEAIHTSELDPHFVEALAEVLYVITADSAFVGDNRY